MEETAASEETLLLQELAARWETGWRPPYWAALREASDSGRGFTVTVTPSYVPLEGET